MGKTNLHVKKLASSAPGENRVSKVPEYGFDDFEESQNGKIYFSSQKLKHSLTVIINNYFTLA
jgi:hypothetical protein